MQETRSTRTKPQKKFVGTATALTAGALLALSVPLAASAHVTIGPNQAAAGSYVVIDFKVPTESATATTTKLVVTIPQDTPFADVSYVPVPGWDVALTTETLAKPIVTDDGSVTQAVTSVTWTAQPGHELTADEYGLFPLSVGPVPDTGSITLKADQTYSDGTVVSWSESGSNAEHPAPVLYVNDTPPAQGDGMVSVQSTATPTAADSTGGSGDVLARALGIGGLVVGVVGIIVGVTGRRKTAA
jgi:uncharacterized protein YcnI